MHTPPQLTWSCASVVPSEHVQAYVLSLLTQMSEHRFRVSSPHSLMSGEGRGGEGGGGGGKIDVQVSQTINWHFLLSWSCDLTNHVT